MRNLIVALGVVGLLAGPALANQCPLLIKQVMDATAGKTDDASKKAWPSPMRPRPCTTPASTPSPWPRPTKLQRRST